MLTQKEKIAWLRLIRCRNVGPRTFWQLLKMHGSAVAALDALPSMAKRAGAEGKTIVSLASVEKEIELTKNFGATFLFEGDEAYPAMLKNIDDKPPVLVAKGRVDLLSQKAGIAIVGSRKASANGLIMASGLAEHLASAGYIVVSGLARGIDAAAHKGALINATAGVIAGGINHVYPFENRALFHQMYEKGVVISEQPFNSMPLPKHFPQRNRIISGISLGVIVIEAAARSGTLITVRYALEQGRDVFAVPGSPLDLRYEGSNALIKSGAHLVQTAEDVIEIVGNMNIVKDYLQEKESEFTMQPAFNLVDMRDADKYRATLMEKLSYSPTSLEAIATHSDIPMHILNYLIVELELAGKAERLFGNKVVLCHEE